MLEYLIKKNGIYLMLIYFMTINSMLEYFTKKKWNLPNVNMTIN